MSDENPAGQGSGPESASTSAAEQVISAFGGLRPMAKQLGVAVSTVQGWKQRQHIPESRLDAIRTAARENDVDLEEATLQAAAGGATGDGEAEPPSEPQETAEETEEQARETEQGEAAAAAALESGVSESTPTAGPAAAAPPEGGGGAGRFFGGLVLGAVIFAGGVLIAVATRDTWLATIDGPGTVQSELSEVRERVSRLEASVATQKAVGDLEQRLSGLSTRLEDLGSQVNNLAAGDVDLGPVTDRIDDISGRLEAVEGEVASDDTAARVENLADEVSALQRAVSTLEANTATAEAVAGVEESLSSLQARIDEVASQRAATAEEAAADAALVLGIGRITERLEAGEGFAEPLAQVRLLAKSRGAISGAAEALDPYKGGVPSRAKLVASFGEVADAAARAGMGAQIEEGWLRRIVGRVSEVISVRPTGGDAEGGHPGAIVARAEAELAADNLAGAVAEIEQLSGGAAEAAAGWLQSAKGRLAAEAALRRLSQASLEALSNTGSEG